MKTLLHNLLSAGRSALARMRLCGTLALVAVSNTISISYALAPSTDESIYKRGVTQMENILPPAPEAASVVKYVDIPFSHSQGLANLEIPLWTLEGRELSIPISLSYATGGIKLDEVAGVAGLGWTLNAGGCVTRTVMDMPDEFSDFGFRHEMPSSSLLAKLENNTSDTETMGYLRDVVHHMLDSSLDRFSYNVCGLTGSFVITDDGTVFHLSGDGVTITPDYQDGHIDRFTIVGPDGTVYLLSEKETGHHDGSADHQFTPTSGEPDRWDAITAWHLRRVTSRSGLEVAEFNYSQARTWTRNTWARTRNVSFDVASGTEESSQSDSYRFTASSYDVKALTSIELSGYRASFSYSTDTGCNNHYVSFGESPRNHPFMLTGISVSYDGAAVPLAGITVGTAKDPHDGRIVLNSLRIHRGTSLDDRWDFTYSTLESAVSQYSQDWFGYYNGEDDAVPHSRGGVCPFDIDPAWNIITLSHGYPVPSRASYMSMLTADHDGAKTEFTYEGAALDATGSGLESITAGVRVYKIRIYDNGTLCRVRKFTYEDPHADGPTFPLANLYTTTGVSLSQTLTSPSNVPILHHDWSFGVHETPVAGGPSVRDTRAFYGKVTEDVAGVDTFRPAIIIPPSLEPIDPDPIPGVPILSSNPTSRTVRYFSTADLRYGWTSTISRFPPRWESDYTSIGTRPVTIDPFTGIRDGYTDDGPSAPALLTRLEEYSSEDGSSFRLLSSTDYTYGSDLSRGRVLTEYRAVQVMQRLHYGDLQQDDIYHYPVLTSSSPGKRPTSEHHVEYHGEGVESNYDETTTSTSYLPRSGLDVPVRVASTSMTEAGVTRTTAYTYPDTWTGGGAWAQALAAGHALTAVLRKDFRTESAGEPAMSEITEYGLFHVGGAQRLMPQLHRELTAGVESWREQFIARDRFGNVSCVKETGRPMTAILWGWYGLLPAAVIEGADAADITAALGSQSADSFTGAGQPSAAQMDAVSALRVSPILAGALVTTFRWQPGIGLCSSTDPAGVSVSYSYDCNGRLEYVRDGDGNAVESYAYSLLNDGSGRLSLRRRSYSDASGGSWSEDVRWFDTLGREIQDIAVAGSGDGRDLVTAREGDFMLHDDVKIWLPYPDGGTAGAFRNAAAAASSAWHGSDMAYYSKTYEASGRDRLLSSAEPGYAGSHETGYTTDSQSTYPILVWGDSGITQAGVHATQSLVKETVTNPDGVTVHAVKDHAGRIIAEGRGDGTLTYYVYDGRDRLRAVAGGGIPMADTLNMWRYSYDTRNRVSSMGIPGCARESYEYYANSDTSACGGLPRYRYRGDERTEYLYDGLGRITCEKLTDGQAPERVTARTFYDSYPASVSSLVASATGSGSWDGPSVGLKTCTETALVDAEGGIAEGYATTVWLYDGKERPVWVITGYSDGRVLRESITYDFCGNVTSDLTIHVHDGGTDSLTVISAYDSRGRIVSKSITLREDGRQPVSAGITYGYDALGRPTSKTVTKSGSQTVLSTTDSLSLQGWLASRAARRGDDLVFSQNLTHLPSRRIASISESWSIPEKHFTRTELRQYSYTSGGRLSQVLSSLGLSETFTYDPRGNITSATYYDREIDENVTESFSYSGDRLNTMTRGEGQDTEEYSFTYDNRGRMTYCGAEGKYTAYNFLDLPSRIGSGPLDYSANYYYLADGMKTRVRNTEEGGAMYVGPFVYGIYDDDDGGVWLEDAVVEDVSLCGDGVVARMTDYLGSARAVVDMNDGQLYDEFRYSAYGMPAFIATEFEEDEEFPYEMYHKLRFTGKEDQRHWTGTRRTDFGARHLDHTIRQWMVPDPLSEKYYTVSPYAYCAGDPVNKVDPDGEELQFAHWVSNGEGVSDGEWVYGISNICMEYIESFAKTDIGYTFLSQFAKAGQTIGSVIFTSDGEYSNNNIKFNEYSSENATAGSSGLACSDCKNFTVTVQLNDSYGDILDHSITIGHELFIHAEPVVEQMTKAIQEGDLKKYAKIFIYNSTPSNKDVIEANDHKAYLSGNRPNFDKLVKQLSFSYGSYAVNRAKMSHDNGIK